MTPAALLILWLTLAPSPASAAEPGLAARSEALLLRAGGVRPASPDSLAGALVSTGDSLIAQGQDSLGVVCLEQGGQLYLKLGRMPEAIALLERGLAASRANGSPPLTATLLNSLAMALGQGGSYEECLLRLEEAVRIRRQLGDVRREGMALANMANAYSQSGRLPEALAATDSALTRDRQSGNTTGLLANYNRLSGIAHTLERLPEALAWSDSAVAIARRHKVSRPLPVVLRRRAAILHDMGRNEEALEALDQAMAVALAQNDGVEVFYNRIRRAEILVRSGQPAAGVALIDSVGPQVAAMGNEDLMLQLAIPRAGALLDLSRNAEAESLLVASVARLEARAQGLESASARTGLLLKAGELYAALARCHLAAGRTAEAWAVIERGRAPVLESRLGGQGSIPLAEIQERLGRSNGILVQFNDPGFSPLGAFMIAPGSLEFVSFESTQKEITADARTALDRMAEGGDPALFDPILVRLSAALLAPILDTVPAGKDSVRRVAFILPSALTGFPMEALPLPGGGKGATLADRWAVSYLPSATALRHLEHVDSGRGMVVFADPGTAPAREAALIPSEREDLADVPLRYAREEARRVAIQGARVYRGEAAVVERVRDPETRGASVLHFATHALLNPSRPEDSAILLAGNDPFLSAADVESLALAADLVTLSGCRTGRGYTSRGEGTFGLARSFLIAGARSVVTSRWDVDDKAASRFMTVFYQGLRAGSPRDESLTLAQRRLRAEGYPARDWAAFLLTGVSAEPVAALAGQPVKRPSRLPLLVALALGAVAITASMARRGRREKISPGKQ